MKLKTDGKMHNKKQKLTFFYFLDNQIEEDLFLPKIIRSLEEHVSQEERYAIKKRAESIEMDEDMNTLKIIALFYCLHIQKPRNGHMAMFTRRMIRETDISLEVDDIKEYNAKLMQAIHDMGLPPFDVQESAKQFIKNIYYYQPDFIDKYPQLYDDVTQDS